ncbi:MAG TPA: DUF1330 domain-containing protein [Dokdonella sp.]
MTQTHLEPTQESGRAFVARGSAGPVVVPNLLRFRAVADDAESPALARTAPISGETAYRLYMEATPPHLRASCGEILFFGRGDAFLIGPHEERRDAAMLVRRSGVAAFLASASNAEYLAGVGHRRALADSRLLPRVEEPT